MIDRLRPLSLVILAACALLTTACTSQRVADEASIADAKRVMTPTMGAVSFFDGQLLVEVNLGRGFRPRMVKPGWKSRTGENAFATTIYADEAAREIAEEEEEGMFIPRMRNSTLPPVALRLRVHNLTTAPVEIEFIECKSYLGNFAIRPEKLTIASGESGQPDPMVSLLGVGGREIPVTVTLRLGDKRETHTVILVPFQPPAQPPASPVAP